MNRTDALWIADRLITAQMACDSEEQRKGVRLTALMLTEPVAAQGMIEANKFMEVAGIKTHETPLNLFENAKERETQREKIKTKIAKNPTQKVAIDNPAAFERPWTYPNYDK